MVSIRFLLSAFRFKLSAFCIQHSAFRFKLLINDIQLKSATQQQPHQGRDDDNKKIYPK